MCIADTCLIDFVPYFTTTVLTKSVVTFCLMSGFSDINFKAMSIALGILASIPWIIIVFILI